MLPAPLHCIALLLAASGLSSASDDASAHCRVGPRSADAKHAKLSGEDFFGRRARDEGRVFCVVRPRADGGDDGPAIMDAFNRRCRSRGFVFLPGPTYHIDTSMTTLGLDNVTIVQPGRMRWSADINHWRSVSMPVGFQNQTTVWHFGGDGVTWDGCNTGTLDGNGQAWYDWAKGRVNLAHRPMNIHLYKLTNSVVRRMRFVQSQMWTMAITHSARVELADIYVNSTSRSQWSTLNTDGCDTVNSDRITFRRWVVDNGDDSIALKGNSTNISIHDSVFHNGFGVAIGSLGQYRGRAEHVSDVLVKNMTMYDTTHVSYFKTWSGTSRGFPPNGGGGGVGQASNIVVEDVRFRRMRKQPFVTRQCENYEGHKGEDCDSSKFKIRRIAWRRVRGTVVGSVRYLGWLQCSAGAGGCRDIEASDIDVKKEDGAVLDVWHCGNVHGTVGFRCPAHHKMQKPSRCEELETNEVKSGSCRV